MFDKLQTVIFKVESRGAEFVDARYDELLIRTIVKVIDIARASSHDTKITISG